MKSKKPCLCLVENIGKLKCCPSQLTFMWTRWSTIFIHINWESAYLALPTSSPLSCLQIHHRRKTHLSSSLFWSFSCLVNNLQVLFYLDFYSGWRLLHHTDTRVHLISWLLSLCFPIMPIMRIYEMIILYGWN